MVNLTLDVFAQSSYTSNMRQQCILRFAAFAVCLTVVAVTLHWNSATYRDFNEDLRRRLLSFSENTLPTTNPAPVNERTNIFFLKAHKCASSTLQNILLRFGFARELDFVLPLVNNYIGSPLPFHADMINKDLVSLSGKYNIFTHHTRYNVEEMKAVMYDDSAFVTILRHPADVFESIYSYYKFNRSYNLTLEELIKTPSKIELLSHRFLKKIGVNQMSFDLGMWQLDFSSEEEIQKFVNKIDNEFDLVMISEYMEASLVLLCDLMSWPLENVISLKLNSRPEASKYSLTEDDRKVLTDFNHADNVLYQHFLNKFRLKIKEYGEERMKENVSKLIHLNEQFNYRCVEGLNVKGYGHTMAYKLRSSDDWLCVYAARPELVFTSEVRTYQIKKFKVLKKLNSFINDIDVDNYTESDTDS